MQSAVRATNPTMAREMGGSQEANIAVDRKGRIQVGQRRSTSRPTIHGTAIQDGLREPGARPCAREVARGDRHNPAIDPLGLIEPVRRAVGIRKGPIRRMLRREKIMQTLLRGLQDIIAILGMEERRKDDKQGMSTRRARSSDS